MRNVGVMMEMAGTGAPIRCWHGMNESEVWVQIPCRIAVLPGLYHWK